MKTSILGRFRFDFDHGQFLVYDVSVEGPQCEWTEVHCNQGFARRESAACIATMLQDGSADVTVFFGPFVEQESYQRVIALPFHAPEGKIVIGGLLELYLAHVLFCPRGHYKLYVAQWIADEEDEREGVHLFFHPQEEPVTKSEITLADEGLSPPAILLESAATISDF
jgi:hypothetical protein